MAVPENEAIVRDQIRLLDDGEVVGSANLFAESGTNHGMSVTRDQIEIVLHSLRQAMPDSATEILEMMSDGDVVACRIEVTGTHQGTPDLPFVAGGVFAAVEPTGTRVTTTQIHWYRIVEGKIVEHWANRDDLGVARQLGIVEGIPARA